VALPFPPNPGTLVICDFRGFVKPEMVKPRLCVVISPRRRNGGPKLCTVVPLSCTTPDPVEGFHCRLQINPVLPPPFCEPEVWVKGDMLYTVSLERLDFPHKKDANGNREFVKQIISMPDLKRVKRCVAIGLGYNLTT
jgi:uncharacterized protein YifN (PemK superfamily)